MFNPVGGGRIVQKEVSTLSRRRCLQAGVASVLAPVIGCSESAFPARSDVQTVAGPWGTAPENGQAALLSASEQPKGILEVLVWVV